MTKVEINKELNAVFEIVDEETSEVVGRMPDLNSAKRIALAYTKGLIPSLTTIESTGYYGEDKSEELLEKTRKHLSKSDFEKFCGNISTVNFSIKTVSIIENGKEIKH